MAFENTPLPKKAVLIAKHIGINSGGEAIKAYQFAEILKARGVDVTVVTHRRALLEQGAGGLDVNFLIVEDSPLQRFFWKVRPLRGLLDPHFHIFARRQIVENVPADTDTVLHYIAPVSPVTLRFFPRGYDIVLGPLTGNIFYPPAFRARSSWEFRTAERLHRLAQRALGTVYPEKRRARSVLVSGYERTRESLRMAGVRDAQMTDVVDSGVSDRIRARPRITHEGTNPRFVCSGRMVDHKGTDLAIKAVARADPDIRLDIYGDGPKRAELETLAASLNLSDRVRFLGWMDSHDALLDAFSEYRGYVFPSVAEANGIVMQEAMMVGLPVIATRWGGPAHLADDETALYVDPLSEEHMVAGIAEAMNRLAHSPELAEKISRGARTIAEEKFSWEAVAASWVHAGYLHGTDPDRERDLPAAAGEGVLAWQQEQDV